MIGRKHKALSPLACASGSKRKKPSSSSSGKRGKALSPLACASGSKRKKPSGKRGKAKYPVSSRHLFKTSTMPRDEEKPVPPHAKDDCKVNPCDAANLAPQLAYPVNGTVPEKQHASPVKCKSLLRPEVFTGADDIKYTVYTFPTKYPTPPGEYSSGELSPDYDDIEGHFGSNNLFPEYENGRIKVHNGFTEDLKNIPDVYSDDASMDEDSDPEHFTRGLLS